MYETRPGETGKYAALSHCWGPGYPLRSLNGNIEDMKTRVNPEDLNNTFKNAIEVTKRLGLRYIWIDSLCIIQDDSNDWEEQAAQMVSIYKNAHVTIAPGFSISVFGNRCLGKLGCPPRHTRRQAAPSEAGSITDGLNP